MNTATQFLKPEHMSNAGNRAPELMELIRWSRRPLALNIGISVAVLGGQLGDEGKGSRIAWLVNQVGIKLTVRFQGGCNAGHQISMRRPCDGVLDDIAVHFISEGLLFGGISAHGANTVINPWKLADEIKKLQKQGFEVRPDNWILDPRIIVATAFERHAGNINDKDERTNTGSTQSLIRECYMARAGKYGVTVHDCVIGGAHLHKALMWNRSGYNDRNWVNEIDLSESFRELEEFGRLLKEHALVTDVLKFVTDWQQAGGDYVLVGSQGVHLDCIGNMPLGTSSSIWPPQWVPHENGIVLMVIKLLGTCAGPHLIPTRVVESDEVEAQRNQRGDKGKTSGRPYWYYELALPDLHHSVALLRPDGILISKADLDCGKIVVWKQMRIDGKAVMWRSSEMEFWDRDPGNPTFTSDRLSFADRCELPAIKGKMTEVTDWNQLPGAFHERVAWLEGEIGVPIIGAGVGPGAEHTALRPWTNASVNELTAAHDVAAK